MEIKSKIWFEIDGQAVMGAGRLKLLRAIEATGSITEASKKLEMSYKKAWKLVKLMNESCGTPLLEKTTGGKGGGGTVLTAKGQELMQQYQEVKSQLHTKIDELAKDLELL